MDTLHRSPSDRNTLQAINSLKKGSYLLKYGRWGKPKFCPFQLSKDETALIWYAGKEQKQLQLSQVSRIIPGQRTTIFQRFPQPEKEYQSFSLLYGKKSLDVICKDKYEAEIWFVALRALISRGNCQKWKTEIRTDDALSDSSSDRTERTSSLSVLSHSSSDAVHEDKQIDQIMDVPLEGLPQKSLGRAFSEIVLHKAASLRSPQRDAVHCSNISQLNGNIARRSSEDALRVSYSSGITSSVESSPGHTPLSSIFVWGEGFDDGLLDGGMARAGESSPDKDAFMPKILESASALDAENLACGSTHAILVTRQGQVFSWGDGSGGKLGHGLDADICGPKHIDALEGLNVVSVGCGEYHTCAVTQTGDLYTWGDGIHNSGLLGHGTELSYWTPRKVGGQMEGIHVTSVSCGPWHSAAITSQGKLFTFGEGTFGALGHGDRCSTNIPREVEALKGQNVVRVSCGFWHTAAIVEVPSELPTSGNFPKRKLFTWGNGDEGQLGHGDELSRLAPYCVAVPNDRISFCEVACGHSITVALTICGQVYTIGITDRGELKRPGYSHMLPARVEGKLKSCVIKEISCGSHHVAAVTSTSEMFTWGKGRNGQLGHGDNTDRHFPTLVKALEGKHVKRVSCGNNYTVAICLHQWVCSSDYSVCSGCNNPFNFKRKRHNCYNCGLLFCNDCTSKRSLNASLAPHLSRSYRVCDDCFLKLNKGLNSRGNSLPPRSSSKNLHGNTSKEKKVSFSSPQGSVLARLSSFNSLKKAKKQHAKKNKKLEPSSSRNSPIYGGNTGYDGSPSSSPSTSIVDGCDRINALVTGSTSSPVSTKSNNSLLLHPSLHSHPCQEEVIGDSKQINDDLVEEISFLREQVEGLSRKSQLLSAELERTSYQLDEATAWFQQESEKNNAAKEAIKLLMNQMKEMTSGTPHGASCRPFADKQLSCSEHCLYMTN